MTAEKLMICVCKFTATDKAFIIKSIREMVGDKTISYSLQPLNFEWYEMMYRTLAKLDKHSRGWLNSNSDWQEFKWLKEFLYDFCSKTKSESAKQKALELYNAMDNSKKVI